MRFILSLSSFITAVLAVGRFTAPHGGITVGPRGRFSTIQAAVNSLRTDTPGVQKIFIMPGTYREQVIIPKRKATLKIFGYTSDTSSYKANVVNIIHSSSPLSGAANDKATGTVINDAANSAMYNINIKNTYGQGSQAVALSAFGPQQAYYAVGLYGYQDTLYANAGRQFYGKCYIEGAVDFIFAKHGIAWITGSDLRISGPGAVTANGRPSASDPSMFVINKCSIDKTSTSTAAPGTAYLGRPWTQFATVIVQNSVLGSIINPAGWSVWQPTNPQIAAVTFQEFGNTGPGAATRARAKFSSVRRSAVTIASVLGSGYTSWVDPAYM